jgi:hypothetical protein
MLVLSHLAAKHLATVRLAKPKIGRLSSGKHTKDYGTSHFLE